jgi:hypothetical protein
MMISASIVSVAISWSVKNFSASSFLSLSISTGNLSALGALAAPVAAPSSFVAGLHESSNKPAAIVLTLIAFNDSRLFITLF